MRSTRRFGITAMTAAIALSLGAVPVALTVPSIVAGGEDTTIVTPATALTPGAISAGAVVLTTTSTKGTVTYNGAVQEFTGGQQCEVTPIAGGANLLTISGSVGSTQSGTARAGFRDGDIGVFETETSTPDNASQCFRVDAGSTTLQETLTLELPADGPYSDAPFSARLLAESATVDARVGNTRSGSIKISLRSASGTWVEHPTAATWNNAKSGSTITFPLLQGSFTGVRLTATSGSFSLRGATLNLVSQADEEFCVNESYTDPTRATTSVTYVGPATGRCFGIALTSGPTFLRFLKPPTVSPEAQFVFNARWTTPNDGRDPSVQITDAEIAFDINETNFRDMDFCSEFAAFNDAAGRPILGRTTTGNLKVNNYEAFSGDARFIDFEGSVTAKQWACIDTRIVTVTAPQIVVDDTFFAVGDLRTRY